MNITTFFTIAGGVALFLYGIKLLSASLQNLAGDKLRQLLGELTKTPLRGIIVGIIVTVLIQSSAGTTVMTVSFVNNGLLSLQQALGLIMGANIGTTVTAQLLAFNIGTLAYRNKKARLEVSRTFSSWPRCYNNLRVVLVYVGTSRRFCGSTLVLSQAARYSSCVMRPFLSASMSKLAYGASRLRSLRS